MLITSVYKDKELLPSLEEKQLPAICLLDVKITYLQLLLSHQLLY